MHRRAAISLPTSLPNNESARSKIENVQKKEVIIRCPGIEACDCWILCVGVSLFLIAMKLPFLPLTPPHHLCSFQVHAVL